MRQCEVHAYYLGGPRDGQMVHELIDTHRYREAPTVCIGDVAQFRFFVYAYHPRDALQAIVDMLTTTMRHRAHASGKDARAAPST